MSPVELIPIQGSLILRARGSELLILAQYIAVLQEKKEAKDFAEFFMKEALMNRPARKLFEAWLRKDKTLWKRLYHTVQNEIEVSKEAAAESAPEVPVEETPVEAEAPVEAEPAAPKENVDSAEKKPVKKKAAKKKAAKKVAKKKTSSQ